MSKLQNIKNSKTVTSLSFQERSQLKGGGWGSGSKSNGHGCSPPHAYSMEIYSDEESMR